MKKRVRVVDADTGALYSFPGNAFELVTCDEENKVHYVEGFIVAAQRGWEVLGLDCDNLMVRRWKAYRGITRNFDPCKPPSWFNAAHFKRVT